jgi:plastocyanin
MISRTGLQQIILGICLTIIIGPAYGGTIKGEVKYTGDKRKRKPVDMSVDGNCKKVHGDAVVLDPRFAHAKNGNLTNVLIYVDNKALKSKKFDKPTTKVSLDQKGCIYIPHVLGIVIGQSLEIKNSDTTLHNVNCKAKKNTSFNQGMAGGMKLTKTFKKYERNINFKCDVHPWMGAKLHVFDHPFFAVSDKDGKFEIKNLPAGKYTLRFDYESSSYKPVEKTIEIEIGDDDTKQITVNYQRKPKKKKKK